MEIEDMGVFVSRLITLSILSTFILLPLYVIVGMLLDIITNFKWHIINKKKIIKVISIMIFASLLWVLNLMVQYFFGLDIYN